MEGESHTTVDSLVLEAVEANNVDIDLEDVELLIDTDYTGPLKPTVEAAIQAKWSKIMGPGVEIVVSILCVLPVHLLLFMTFMTFFSQLVSIH